jgi:large subunit ribosomal protein L17
MLKNLASSLILTERDSELDDNAPKVKGRVVTTLHKAKEVQPLVEKCVTIARKSLVAAENANQFATTAERGTDAWKTWKKEGWSKWADARGPVVAARRRALQLLGDKQAVDILFTEIAPRFAERPGGYTRVLKLAGVRLGDAGKQAILEFVGKNDRVKKAKSEKPAFEDSPQEEEAPASEEVAEEPQAEAVESAGDDTAATDSE